MMMSKVKNTIKNKNMCCERDVTVFGKEGTRKERGCIRIRKISVNHHRTKSY